MWTLLFPLAFAADPVEVARVYYLAENHGGDEGRVAARALVEAHPQDLGAQAAWMYASTFLDGDARERLVPTYRLWVAENPGDPVRTAALGYAIALAAAPSYEEFGRPGPWCDQALAEIGATLPDTADDRALVLALRRRVLGACQRDHAAEDADLLALAEETPRAYAAAIGILMQDGVVDEADAGELRRVVEPEPWRASHLRRLWAEDVTGAGLDAARSYARDLAITLSASDDPMLVDASVAVLRAAGDSAALEAALLRLSELDARRLPSDWKEAFHLAPDRPAKETGTNAMSRLWAHDQREDDYEGPERGAWHAGRAELLTEMGRDGEALAELRLAHRRGYGVEHHVAFARATAAQERWLGRGLRAANGAIHAFSDPSLFGRTEMVPLTRDDVADALRARSRIHLARGHDEKAAVDAWQALLLQEHPESHALLALSLESVSPADAFEYATLALDDGGSRDRALDAEVRAALERLWGTHGVWVPGGIDGWLAIRGEELGAVDVAQRRKAADQRVGHPFPDLAITVGGVPTALSAYPGPIVVELWATWCGPCKRALPHFDAIARKHPEIPFVAISVDKDVLDASYHLAGSDVAFVKAWAGPDALRATGVDAIPTTFVLDAEHRIVLVISGFNASELEGAIAAPAP